MKELSFEMMYLPSKTPQLTPLQSGTRVLGEISHGRCLYVLCYSSHYRASKTTKP
ncbi:MAG: hypothetical protein AB8Y53_03215 [Coxiella-like endosymbiont]